MLICCRSSPQQFSFGKRAHRSLRAGDAGSAVSNAVRWGDYSSMSIDPSDDCTFWYLQEYQNKKNGGGVSSDWSTYLIAFKFDSYRGSGLESLFAPFAPVVA